MRKREQSEHLHWLIFIGIVALVTFGGYFVLYPQTLFKPGERLFDAGYNLGLAGGVMILIMLLYSVRKRVKYFRNLGALSTWFKWHMILGILGPMTIVFHSTYHVYIPYLHPTGSPNAAVAMLCMLVVSGSGTFGRFFYTKIHNGLYGRQSTVNELRAELEQSGDVKSMLHFAPEVEKALENFRARADGYAQQPGVGLLNFLTVGVQAARLSRSLPGELHRIMHAEAKLNNFSAMQMANMEAIFQDYRKKIRIYIQALRDASQFNTYERMFSWWHIFHIPLVYMMVFAACYHVYAVHAY